MTRHRIIYWTFSVGRILAAVATGASIGRSNFIANNAIEHGGARHEKSLDYVRGGKHGKLV